MDWVGGGLLERLCVNVTHTLVAFTCQGRFEGDFNWFAEYLELNVFLRGV